MPRLAWSPGVACPLYIDGLHAPVGATAPNANLIPGGIVNHEIGACHRGAHRLAVGNVARRQGSAQLDKRLRSPALLIAHQRRHRPAPLAECADQWDANEPRTACKKDMHAFRLWPFRPRSQN